jgi:hypothetical protein
MKRPTTIEGVLKAFEEHWHPDEHKEDCAQQAYEWCESAEVFIKMYPKACTKCWGWG